MSMWYTISIEVKYKDLHPEIDNEKDMLRSLRHTLEAAIGQGLLDGISGEKPVNFKITIQTEG